MQVWLYDRPERQNQAKNEETIYGTLWQDQKDSYPVSNMSLEKISSFAAPTAQDIRAFEILTPAEQQAVIYAELEKGFDGKPVSVTKQTSRGIFKRALSQVRSSDHSA